MTTKDDDSNTARSQLPLIVRAKYMVVRAGLGGIVKLAGLDGLYLFGQAFAYCEYLLKFNRRRRIYRRLDQIYGRPLPKREKRKIARKFFARIRCDKMLYTVMDRIDKQKILERVEVEGIEELDRAVANGSGTFLMFSHQGSHHLGGILLTLSGYPVIGLRDPKEGLLRIYIQQRFEKHFPEFGDLQITPSNTFAKPFFRAFRSNRIVAAAMDVWRDRGNVRTVTVNVFGGRQEFLSGMTHIALRCKAVVLVGFLLSLPRYRYRMIFHPWLSGPETGGDDQETVQQIMQKYATIIEAHVRKYPCHISKTK